MGRRHTFKVIEAEPEGLGEQISALLEQGGLTAQQAEKIRAELEKVGFVRFRRSKTPVLPRLILRPEDRSDQGASPSWRAPRLYLRQSWRTDAQHKHRAG